MSKLFLDPRLVRKLSISSKTVLDAQAATDDSEVSASPDARFTRRQDAQQRSVKEDEVGGCEYLRIRIQLCHPAAKSARVQFQKGRATDRTSPR